MGRLFDGVRSQGGPTPQDSDAACHAADPRIRVRAQALERGEVSDPSPHWTTGQNRQRLGFDTNLCVDQERREQLGPVVAAKLECGRDGLPHSRPRALRRTFQDHERATQRHVPAQGHRPNRELEVWRSRGVGQQCNRLGLLSPPVGEVEVERCLGVER